MSRAITPTRLGTQRRGRRELEFLPAALEVLATPPPLASRALVALIIASTLAALAWAAVGEVDKVVVAPGSVVPGGQVKRIQPFQRGTVLAVHVHEGQRVTRGQLLVELDATDADADVRKIRRSLSAARLDAARALALAGALRGQPVSLESALAGLSAQPKDASAAPHLTALQVSGAELDQAAGHLAQSLVAHESKVGELRADLRRLRATLETHRAELSRTEALLPILHEREATLATLLAGGAVPRPEWLDARERLVGAQHDQRIEAERLGVDQQAIVAADEKLRTLRAAALAQALVEATRWQRETRALELTLAKAEQRRRLHTLRAPVAGIVAALSVHTVGGVVTPAEKLMEIVPADVPLRVEAMVENKDAGFVHTGQFVEVKVDSFPFTRYGLLTGRITRVSADAVDDPQRGAVFKVEAMLAQQHVQVGQRNVPLSPGMSVVAEVKAGTRTILEFLLDPALRASREALRER